MLTRPRWCWMGGRCGRIVGYDRMLALDDDMSSDRNWEVSGAVSRFIVSLLEQVLVGKYLLVYG